jgi:magnesium transporter
MQVPGGAETRPAISTACIPGGFSSLPAIFASRWAMVQLSYGPMTSVTTAAEQVEALKMDWARLSGPERVHQFRELHTGEKADFFLELSARDQKELLLGLPEEQWHVWLRLLPPDDAADLLQECDEADRPKLLDLLDEATRRDVSALMAYKEDKAGGLMSPRFARLRPESTVDEAITYLRRQTASVETIYYTYVLDHDQHLLGVLSLRELFSADPRKHVRELMHPDFISVSDETDQKHVATVIRQNRLLAVPVLHADGRMIGIVTVDDIVDVVEEEAARDIQNIGGSEAIDGPYLQIPFFELVRKRAGWLAILFVGEMFTATAMNFFSGEIEKAVVLALFLPLIISSGGNSGSQATTLVIQAMAAGQVHLRDWFLVIRRELFAGVALGCVLGVIGMLRIFVWQSLFHTYGAQHAILALTIACSLVGVVTFGTLAGSMLPFILRKCGLNPASASAPFVATLVDVTGLVIYFSIARAIMLR